MLKKSLVIGITLLFIVGCGEQKVEQNAETSTNQPEDGQVLDGDILASLADSFTDIDGNTFDITSLKGKVIMIDFWDTWCPPCKKGIPEFVHMKDRMKDKNFELLGIVLMPRDGIEAVKKFKEEYNINYPVLIGRDRDTVTKVFEIFGAINVIPTAFIIDQTGSIKFRQQGYTPAEAFEGAINKMLK